jgi:hypothetical protein
MNNTNNAEAIAAQELAPYVAPRLVSFGAVRDLTAAGSLGANEGAGTDPARRA